MSTTNEMLDGREYDEARDLADELSEMQLMSTGDREVRARLLPPEESDGKVVVKAELPDGDVVKRQFDKPKPWADRYRFVWFAESYGYGPDSIMNLAGEEVTVKRTTDEEWKIVNPGSPDYNLDDLRGLAAGLMFSPVAAGYVAYGPLFGAFCFILYVMCCICICPKTQEDD